MLGHLFISLLIGALAGWLSGIIMGGRHSLGMNILIGLLGGSIGGFLFGLFGISSYSFLGDVLVAAIGACVLIFIVRKLR